MGIGIGSGHRGLLVRVVALALASLVRHWPMERRGLATSIAPATRPTDEQLWTLQLLGWRLGASLAAPHPTAKAGGAVLLPAGDHVVRDWLEPLTRLPEVGMDDTPLTMLVTHFDTNLAEKISDAIGFVEITLPPCAHTLLQ